jgi:hypothetical protein
LKTAKSGGKSELASSVTIYNELLKRDPKIIETLVSYNGHSLGMATPSLRPTDTHEYKLGLKLLSQGISIYGVAVDSRRAEPGA